MQPGTEKHTSNSATTIADRWIVVVDSMNRDRHTLTGYSPSEARVKAKEVVATGLDVQLNNGGLRIIPSHMIYSVYCGPALKEGE